MRNLLEYEYVHIDSDFILIGLTIQHIRRAETNIPKIRSN